jgi:hypothetical protein
VLPGGAHSWEAEARAAVDEVKGIELPEVPDVPEHEITVDADEPLIDS